MNRTQLNLTTALAGATLAFACGRAEIETGADEALSYNLLNPAIDIAEIQEHPALADTRLTNLQVLRHSLPPINLHPVAPQASYAGPMLTEWNRSIFTVAQIEFMPLILEEADERFQVFFDAGRLVRWARWNAIDGRWNQIPGVEYVATDRLVRPLSMWSDLLGIVELADCRQDVDGTYACNAKGFAKVDTYFPRPLEQGEGPTQLVCLAGCPNPNASGGQPYFENIDDPAAQSPADVAVAYAYDREARMLMHEGERVLPPPGEPEFVSGFMFAASHKYLDDMACQRNGKVAEGVCVHNPQDRFYTWSSHSTLQATSRYPRAVD